MVYFDQSSLSKDSAAARVLSGIEKVPAKSAPNLDTGKREGSLGDYRGLGWRQ